MNANFLRKSFPFLSLAASAFGGPIGAAGANLLGAILKREVKPENIESELTNLAVTDEGRLKALEAENEFKLAMQKMGYEDAEKLEAILASDRDSARKRETIVKDKMPLILALGVNICFFSVVLVLLFRGLPLESKDVLLILLGALTAGWKDVYGYYFGSSAGSASSREAINRIAEKQ